MPEAGAAPDGRGWLEGCGEAGEAIRRHDWSRNPLGAPESWPPSLGVLTSMILAARSPMFVAWGRDARIIYNDAYISILRERHPAVGEPLLEVWPEARAELLPAIAAALAGESVQSDDITLPIFREGVSGPARFSYVYLPFRGRDGTVEGFVCSCEEITGREQKKRREAVVTRLALRLRELADPEAIMGEAARTLAEELGADRCGYATIDATGAALSVRSVWSNGRLPGTIPPKIPLVALAQPDSADLMSGRIVHRSDTTELHGGKGSGVFPGLRGAIACPLVRDGAPVAVLAIHSADVRVWTAQQLDLVQEIGDLTWEAVERARAEAALRESIDRLELASEAAEVSFWDNDFVTGAVFWPTRTRRMFGILDDRELSLDRDFYPALHPDDRNRVREVFDAARDPKRRELYDVEYRTIGRDDGIERWVAAKGRAFFDSDGLCVRALGTAIDITARKLAEERQRKSDERLGETLSTLDALVENAPIGFASFDREHRYVRVNPVLAAINGIPVSEHIGRTVDEVVPRNAAVVNPLIDQVFSSGETISGREVEGETRARPGERRVWLTSIFPVRAIDGSIAYVGWTVIDITGRRRAEQALAELNATLEQRVAERTAERDRIWRNSQDLQTVVGLDGTIITVNPAFQKVLGWRPDELTGRSILDLILPEDHAHTIAGVAKLSDVTNRYATADGGFRWISWVGAREGDLVYGSGRDVTAEKRQAEALERAEESLRQAQKMEAIGQLTGGIAHDFNNLLQGLAGSLDLIQRQPGNPERVKRWAEAGLHAAERGAKLTGQLLAFSRSQRLEVKPVGVSRLFDNVRELVARTIGARIRTRFESDADLGVLGDEVQLEMALLNLAINARDAMPEGGELTIRAHAVQLVDDLELPPGDYVEITVADTGSGMPPDVVARAFDPFFTTKGVGKGTGLGLSQVYGAVRQAGGAARITSIVGEGTTIRLLFRAAEARNVTSEIRASAGPLASARILVVDDDAEVRRFLTETLETLGYAVEAAPDGLSGLAAIERLRPELLLVDFAMPGMNGAELARAVREREPGMPIIFATGYSDTAAIHAAAGEDATVLRKPFGIAQLAAALEAGLSSGREGQE